MEYLRQSFPFGDAQTSFSPTPTCQEDSQLLQKSPFFGAENSASRFDFQHEESKFCVKIPSKKASQFSVTETQPSSSTPFSSLSNQLTIGAFVRRTQFAAAEDSSTTFESSNWQNFDSEVSRSRDQGSSNH
jgi:hypothetical protein